MRREWLADGTLVLLSLCAIIVTTLVVRRELFGTTEHDGGRPQAVEGWSRYVAAGQPLGSNSSGVTAVIFSDFQCPACRALHERLTLVEQQVPGGVRVIYRHYPLEQI